MDLQKEIDSLKVKSGYSGKPQQWQYGFDLACRELAKAQAVPEGFLIVSQKDLLELTIAINAVDLATHAESKTNEVREMWQQVALKLGTLCSTGASQ